MRSTLGVLFPFVLATLLPWTQAAIQISECCDCDSLMPNPVADNTSPQIMPSPFVIKVSKSVYNPRDGPAEQLRVTMRSTMPDKFFTQYILKAVRINTDGTVKDATPQGNFQGINTSYVPVCAGKRAVRQGNNDRKSLVEFAWSPTTNMQGPIMFKATFLEDSKTYWVGEHSEPIIDVNGPPMDKSPHDPNRLPLIAVINTAECGSKKGCYRVPLGCWEPYCQYIATWAKIDTNVYQFEMSAPQNGVTDKYVSMAISDDIHWGNDLVFECVHNGDTGLTQVYQAISNEEYGTDRLPDPKEGIIQEEGHFYDGRVRCRFTKRVSPGRDKDYPISGYHHILMARGDAAGGKAEPHNLGPGEIPVASPEEVTFSSAVSISDYARYPLVKAHGILMILAWCFFGTIGLLMTKYYKPMWPNKRFYGERYWFIAHFNCMAWLFLLVIIAFILIFIEVGGYSKAHYLPYKAHPILGIIIFCCVIINPVIALLRPPEDHRCRPVVNWFHWAFGTIAWCLSIPNIFIGMDFGKAMVPWWSTWILCIYIIFHIIVEITLEVHQCCTHKKNKERRKKYEFQKRENPKANIPEPEPAGRRFKRNMFLVHFIVTCIVAFIMLIAIATA